MPTSRIVASEDGTRGRHVGPGAHKASPNLRRLTHDDVPEYERINAKNLADTRCSRGIRDIADLHALFSDDLVEACALDDLEPQAQQLESDIVGHYTDEIARRHRLRQLAHLVTPARRSDHYSDASDFSEFFRRHTGRHRGFDVDTLHSLDGTRTSPNELRHRS